MQKSIIEQNILKDARFIIKTKYCITDEVWLMYKNRAIKASILAITTRTSNKNNTVIEYQVVNDKDINEGYGHELIKHTIWQLEETLFTTKAQLLNSI